MPIYQSESMPALRYSQKPKHVKLIELIIETIEATIISNLVKGFLQQGFFGPTHAVLVISPKPKGSREVKNLECSINFVVKGIHSSRGKGKGTLAIM